jgi:ABC-type nickel/cobalt efflux system permease component RcnA
MIAMRRQACSAAQVRRLVAALTLSAAALLPRAAQAHPMGNFSINHYTRIIAGARTVELDYIIDMAEIPTFQETQERGLITRPGDPALAKYLAQQAETLKGKLTLEAGEDALALECVSRQAIFPPGAGGLPTMKMGFVYRARLPHAAGAVPASLHYRDGNFPGRAGWKEIIALGGEGVALGETSVPSRDRSLELTNYPTDMLQSPPQTLEALVRFRAAPAGARTAGEPLPPIVAGARARPLTQGGASDALYGMRLETNRQGTPRSAFTDLVKSNRMDLAFLLTAALIAAVLGGFHALEPGHGKTMVAAYLVGSRGTARHAVLLGATVTASHTMSVYALGIVTLFASRWVVPEQLYPWLGAVSGLLVAGLGCALFIRRYVRGYGVRDRMDEHALAGHHHHGPGRQHDEHDRHHQHHHHHHDHDDDALASAPLHRHTWWGGHVREDESTAAGAYAHGHAVTHAHPHGDRGASDAAPAAAISLKSLFALGVTGGIVPCPAALVVLLGALAIHRIAFGLFLIVAFSAGLAAVLIALGLAMVFARRFMSRFVARGPLTERWLPLASSAVITVVGMMLTLQSLASAGVL